MFGSKKNSLAGRDCLNLGCGTRFHPAWVNVDVAPRDPRVMRHDLQQPLPFAEATFSAVYHSHVLEHLPRASAPGFVVECLRVLKPGGILRVVVPDLEMIARFYLRECEAAAAGDREAAQRHEWMTIELLDQLVREKSGGEMLHYWRRNPMPAEPFVLERLGAEVRDILGLLRSDAEITKPPPRNEREGARFRASGEVHKWMYDRVSLRALLAGAAFSEIRVCAASESRIPRFASFHLDTDEAGLVRKPDSLFMEAAKR